MAVVANRSHPIQNLSRKNWARCCQGFEHKNKVIAFLLFNRKQSARWNQFYIIYHVHIRRLAFAIKPVLFIVLNCKHQTWILLVTKELIKPLRGQKFNKTKLNHVKLESHLMWHPSMRNVKNCIRNRKKWNRTFFCTFESHKKMMLSQ